MRRTGKFLLTSALALVLCLATVLGTALKTEALTVPNLNYGISGAENNTTLKPSELLELVAPSLGVTNAERVYIDENLTSFTYNSALPQEAVRTLYHKDTGVLDITAPTYTYTAENGSRVTWIPCDVTIGERTLTFQKNDVGDYLCAFDGLHYAEDFEMTVRFAWEVELSEDAVEYFLMQSYADGKAVADALALYEQQMQSYREQVAAHQIYLQYQADKAAYEKYQQDLSEYVLKKAEYDAYVVKKNQYDAELKAYQDYLKAAEEYRIAWQKYQEYSDFMEHYGQAYADYLAYRQQVDRALAKLRVMELLFVKDSHGWNVYGDIMGNTVSIVLENQDLLIKIGYTRADAAGEATRALRTLLKGYADLRSATYASEHDRNKALYTYYCENYEAIKKNFIQLYEALYNLYSNGIVIDYIESQGKGLHFRQFIGALYIVSYCLDDSKVLSMNWTPGKNFKDTLAKWVEPAQILVDNVRATPGSDTFPATEVAKIVPVEEAPQPGEAPARVNPPEEEEPKPVAEPVAPTVVKDPGKAPAYVAMPETEPTAPILTDTERMWAGEYTKVDFNARQSLCEARKLTFEAELVRRVSIDNSFKITFYSHDGKTVCSEQVLKYGDSADMIDYSFRPTREPNAQYTYDFVAWTLFNGEVWNGEKIESDLSFVPRYRSNLRSYTVTWLIDGETKYQVLIPYGTTPSYPYLLEKPETVEYTYSFAGWDREILPVTGDVTYQGSFDATRRTYTVTWVCGPETFTETYDAMQMPAFEGNPNYATKTHYYVFEKWNTVLLPVTGDVTYFAIYQSIPFSMDAYGVLTETVRDEDTLTVKMNGSAVSFETVACYALEQELDVVLQYGSAGIKLGTDALTLLQSNGCNRISVTDSEADFGRVYCVSFYNLFGRELDVEVPVTMLYYYTAGSGGIPVCYLKNGDEWERLECTRAGGIMRAEHVGAGSFLMRMEYYLQYTSSPNCNTLSLPQQAPVGEWIDFADAGCTYGYEVTGVTVLCSDGTSITVEAMGFQMPQNAVEVTLNVERIVYRVSFVVNGNVISERDYFLGDLIEAPQDPTLDLEDGYVYTFTGWSPSVTLAIGENRNMVFEAEFLASIPGGDKDQEELSDNAITKRLILIAVLAVLVIVLTVLGIVFRRRIGRLIRWIGSLVKAKLRRD